nr:universal stress protein [Mycobacterium sp.]
MNDSPAPQPIVVGIDGSKAALQAALWAVDEALSRDAPLRLLCALEGAPGTAGEGDRGNGDPPRDRGNRGRG